VPEADLAFRLGDIELATFLLGINAFHADSSACLVRDGELVTAAEEERFRRVKHWAGFPSEAIRHCLREAGIGLHDVAHVALNQDTRANFGRRMGYLLRSLPSPALVIQRLIHRARRGSIVELLDESFPGGGFAGQVHRVEHHLAHLASAFLVSPFEEASAVSVDGFGDFASAAWGLGSGSSVAVEEQVYFPHSLGIFYQALTQYLGFPYYGDEYKVMGLAPYGEPRHVGTLRKLVQLRNDGGFRLDLAYFRHATERVEYVWAGGEPIVGTLYTHALEEELGPSCRPGDELTERHRDVARSVQVVYEEALFNLLNHVHARHKSDRLALAGGCAMNSVANGKVTLRTPFKRLYVQPAAGDAGGAIGAAYRVWHQLTGATRRFTMDHAYWGPGFEEAEIAALLEAQTPALLSAGCRVERVTPEQALLARVAQAIADGLVVGWFQGRMEWGPRALGNRSIVCDPRRPDMKDILNRKIKRRESFRPFAPSILREAVNEWFEQDDDVPFMTQVYPIRPEKRPLIPAVTHVDGSGRLQTVCRETNPRYYRLIEAFNSLTGVPIVLNTSFNENEPVVCRPEEALDCFLRTKMDVLVLGDFAVYRKDELSEGASV
jgi:carbamoyltransferase